ncbi:MAG: diphthine--ammonia ligase [Deltaproteobacteria bacterium]|nr:MAG: diphthine--ammonia ligase [Deltaproteobacteria bacterium]
MKEKVLVSWSGGKDSALALYEVLKNQEFEIAALLTTVTENYDRISMHGVRRTLLEHQADALGIPLEKVLISINTTDETYEAKMRRVLTQYLRLGVASIVMGDIFLEDLRAYREANLAKIGMKGVFPIWQRNTRELAGSFINSGFKATITCVDSKVLDKKYVGRNFNKKFISELPLTVDPCGENGEFHSFVYDGPIFKTKVRYTRGEVVLRENRFYFCDLLPTPNH